ncbi:unnamed protein product [Caenorhabditis sp. 36 PRJEB53466]|nr:unnamed protein product [Caenorhabditis sp. 36 PRJEB53466]
MYEDFDELDQLRIEEFVATVQQYENHKRRFTASAATEAHCESCAFVLKKLAALQAKMAEYARMRATDDDRIDWNTLILEVLAAEEPQENEGDFVVARRKNANNNSIAEVAAKEDLYTLPSPPKRKRIEEEREETLSETSSKGRKRANPQRKIVNAEGTSRDLESVMHDFMERRRNEYSDDAEMEHDDEEDNWNNPPTWRPDYEEDEAREREQKEEEDNWNDPPTWRPDYEEEEANEREQKEEEDNWNDPPTWRPDYEEEEEEARDDDGASESSGEHPLVIAEFDEEEQQRTV